MERIYKHIDIKEAILYLALHELDQKDSYELIIYHSGNIRAVELLIFDLFLIGFDENINDNESVKHYEFLRESSRYLKKNGQY